MIRICPNCRKRREFGNRQGYCKKCRATAHRTKYHSDPVFRYNQINDTDKKFAICNGAVHSTEKLLEEVAKCDVRCANCHNIKHYNEFRTGAYARKKKI